MKTQKVYLLLPIPNLRGTIPLPAQASLIPAKGRATWVPSLVENYRHNRSTAIVIIVFIIIVGNYTVFMIRKS